MFRALKEADVVLVAGARLNWILHFGRPPRFARGVKFIHIDSQPEEFHQNVPTAVPLLGDVGETVAAVSTISNDSWCPQYRDALVARADWSLAVRCKLQLDTIPAEEV